MHKLKFEYSKLKFFKRVTIFLICGIKAHNMQNNSHLLLFMDVYLCVYISMAECILLYVAIKMTLALCSVLWHGWSLSINR